MRNSITCARRADERAAEAIEKENLEMEANRIRKPIVLALISYLTVFAGMESRRPKAPLRRSDTQPRISKNSNAWKSRKTKPKRVLVRQ